MSYLNANDLAESRTFLIRVKVALVTAAANVVHEDASGFTPARKDKRNALARAILADPNTYATSFVWGVVANSTIAQNGLDSPDGDIAYQVSAIFDAMAGVTSEEMA